MRKEEEDRGRGPGSSLCGWRCQNRRGSKTGRSQCTAEQPDFPAAADAAPEAASNQSRRRLPRPY